MRKRFENVIQTGVRIGKYRFCMQRITIETDKVEEILEKLGDGK